jgi:hypothetical protein
MSDDGPSAYQFGVADGRAAERERIRQLAIEHKAHYGCYVAINNIQTSGLRPFADLLTEGTDHA